MAVTAKLYGQSVTNAFKKKVYDLTDNTNTHIYCMLTTSSYTPVQDTHENKGQVTNEVVGAGYVANGAEILTKSLAEASRVTTFDGGDVEWLASTITARRAVVYDNSPGADADRKLLLWVDFGEDMSSNNGSFKITWNASGIFTFTVAA